MKEETKPLTQPEQLIKDVRMKFFSLYPTEFKIMAHILLESSDYEWDGDKIIPSYDYSKEEDNLTADGWDHVKNTPGRYPASFGEPNEGRD